LYIHSYKSLESKKWKFLIFFFYKFKRDNSVKNHWTITTFKLGLHMPMMYPYFKFELNVCSTVAKIMNGTSMVTEWQNDRMMEQGNTILFPPPPISLKLSYQ
jgi:hypothetical protein